MTSAGEKGTSTSNVTVQSRDEFDDAGGVVIGAGVVEEDVVGAAVVENEDVEKSLIDARMFSNTSSKSVDFIRGFDPSQSQCPCVVMNDVRV